LGLKPPDEYVYVRDVAEHGEMLRVHAADIGAVRHFVERANQVIECISIAQLHGAGYCCAVPFTTSAKGSPSPELSFMAAEKVQCSWSSLETAGVDGAVST